MKKTLAAVAVLGAFAGSALAADVQLYGIVDTGFLYSHTDTDQAGADAVDKLEMKSGMASGSRFGFKGTEDLGNGLKVGFVLENSFDSDTGSLNKSGLLFHREASLFLEGSFGKLAMGRIGSINNGVSSWAKYGMISAFGTSFTDYAAQAGTFAMGAGMWDNMVAYQTPTFAGFTAYAQYGMGNSKTNYGSVENESSSDRYYALGATYANGPLNLYAAVDSINYASWSNGTDAQPGDVDDSLTVTIGGNFDFEVLTLFAGAQYFDEIAADKTSGILGTTEGLRTDFAGKLEGWGLGVSAKIPAGPGVALVGVGYVDAEAAGSVAPANEKDELTRWVVSAGYDYPFSKRTDIYVAATYMQDSLEYTAATADRDASVIGAMVGLRHKF